MFKVYLGHMKISFKYHSSFKFYTILLIFLMIPVVLESKEIVKFKKLNHNFGEIEYKKPVSFNFQFQNLSKTNLTIYKVITGCGCTSPEYTDTPIQPNKFGFIKVNYNSSNYGDFEKDITVYFEELENPITLTITGKTY
jgi:hypothetical protein